ncbi:MAG: HD domain-containing protein [Bacillota bacterium]
MAGSIGSVIGRMIDYFGNDVRRVNHSLKVYAFSKSLGELEGIVGEQLAIIEAAALLHDIGIKESERKYNSSAGKYQEIEGPPVASEILKEEGFDVEFIKRVCYIVGNHHTYSKIDGMDFQIIVEADFLVNIFEEGMNKEQVKTIKDKYFRTGTGIAYMDALYTDGR